METSLFGRCSTHPHIYIYFFFLLHSKIPRKKISVNI
jgi:hypothetical protein